jgi:uncharacterized protein (DUF3084 family)
VHHKLREECAWVKKLNKAVVSLKAGGSDVEALKKHYLEKESKLLEDVDRSFERVEAIRSKVEEYRLKLEEDRKVLKQNEVEMNGRVARLLAENQELKLRVARLAGDREWLITEGFKFALGKLFNSSEYLDPIYQMQKAVQARGLDVGLAAGYR